MNTITSSLAKEKFDQLLSDVNNTSEPITIANVHGGNVVMLSESDWKAIQETLYLNSIPGMAERIINGMKTAKEDCVPSSEVVW